MEKIEKLEKFNWVSGRDAITIALCNTIIRKQNEIIDHLNSQDQAEENKVCEGCGKTITSRFMQSYTKGDGMHSYCLSCDPEKQETESEVQEWEKKWEEFFLYVTNDKNWVDGRPEWKGNVYITLYNAMKDFIRQLLEEREREVLNSMREWVVEYHKDNWDIRDFDAEIAIGKIIDRELDKLTTK